MLQSLKSKLANDGYTFNLTSMILAGIYTTKILVGEYSYLVNKVAFFQ